MSADENRERQELVKVIADFIEMGHVENIVAMFKQDASHYALAGDLISDERFMVRMGMAVLFEELVAIRPEQVHLAIPALIPLLGHETAYIRGEAANLLAIIGSDAALEPLRPLVDDPDPQVAEIVNDALSNRDAFDKQGTAKRPFPDGH